MDKKLRVQRRALVGAGAALAAPRFAFGQGSAPARIPSEAERPKAGWGAAAGDAWLLSLNAENRELALVDRRSRKTVAAFPLDGSDRGGSDLIVIGGDAVLTNPAAGEVLFVPLASLTARAERPAAATRPAGGTGG